MGEEEGDALQVLEPEYDRDARSSDIDGHCTFGGRF